MKKISKFSLMLVVVLTTMNLYASTVNFSVDSKKEQSKMVTFATNKMNLSIYDANDKLIHSEYVNSKKDFNRAYDLNILPKGNYFLEAKSDTKISKYEISIDKKTASLSNNEISEVYKPIFEYKKGLVWLNILNPDKSPVNIKIYDKEDNEVYDSSILTDQNVTKVFDINNIQNEKYTIIVTDNDRIFTKIFSER